MRLVWSQNAIDEASVGSDANFVPEGDEVRTETYLWDWCQHLLQCCIVRRVTLMIVTLHTPAFELSRNMTAKRGRWEMKRSGHVEILTTTLLWRLIEGVDIFLALGRRGLTVSKRRFRLNNSIGQANFSPVQAVITVSLFLAIRF